MVLGTLYESKSYKWKFTHVDKPYETYSGVRVQLRYFVRLSLYRPYGSTLSKEIDFAVQNPIEEIVSTNSIKMEVRTASVVFCYIVAVCCFGCIPFCIYR